jgi:hypothetical protein
MLTVKDSLGNTVVRGSLLFWRSAGAVVRVLNLQPPEKKGGYGELTLELKVPFECPTDSPFLKDFVAVIDPRQTEMVERIMQGATAKQKEEQPDAMVAR